MRTFSIPFVMEQEEKIFGGYVSIRQAIYLILGVISALIFFTKLHLAVKLIVFSFVMISMLLFAFLKINGTNFDKFTLIVIKYFLRKRKFLFGER